MTGLLGVRVTTHPLLPYTRTEWRVERHPTRKRRRGWRVVRREVPVAYVLSGDTLLGACNPPTLLLSPERLAQFVQLTGATDPFLPGHGGRRFWPVAP